MKLSPHFSLEELTHSDYALRVGILNDPPPEIVDNLRALAYGLEKVRSLLGHPVHITSGYRSPRLNSLIGGSLNSAHTKGFAADFVCPGYGDPKEICKAIRDSDINFDQLIYEGTWVHLSFAPEGRRSILTARFTNGKAAYSEGIT